MSISKYIRSAASVISLFAITSMPSLSQHEGHHAPVKNQNRQSTQKRASSKNARRKNIPRQNLRKRNERHINTSQEPDGNVIHTYETQPTSKAISGTQHQGEDKKHHQHVHSTSNQILKSHTDPTPQEDQLTGPIMRLEDLEAMALKNNPTLAQTQATIRATEGRRRQAGLLPNPVIGYFGEELSFRAFSHTSEHGIFVEQTIPLGGKLGKSQRIFSKEKEQAEILAETQKQRVLNSIRVLYFDALGAQRLVELRTDLARLSREAAEVSEELFNVGQADKPDLFEIQIEAQRAEIDRLKALNDREYVWRLLGAMIGSPELKPSRLVGNLEEGISTLDQETLLNTLLNDSPEIRSAQIGVERARAILARAKAERIPDLFLRGGIGYNNDLLETDNRKIGTQAGIEVGISVPIFNRNQGGIATAQAELEIAEKELQRVQLTLRNRLATAFREYNNALRVVEKYRTEVIPKARAAYEMYLSNFKQMAASYPQVLIAQRTLFQVQVEYARSVIALRQNMVGLRGFLLTGGLDAIGRDSKPNLESNGDSSNH
jgi:outer membrane protein, heavy metal efflux system